jgi:hypothetical protein
MPALIREVLTWILDQNCADNFSLRFDSIDDLNEKLVKPIMKRATRDRV